MSETIEKLEAPAVLHDERRDKGVATILKENPYVAGVAIFASLGGFLFGYDQGTRRMAFESRANAEP